MVAYVNGDYVTHFMAVFQKWRDKAPSWNCFCGSKWGLKKVWKERFARDRGFSKEGWIKSAHNAFTRKLWSGKTLFFTLTLFYSSLFNFVSTIVSLILERGFFRNLFNEWIMYSLLQISFQERFERYWNQLANWQC